VPGAPSPASARAEGARDAIRAPAVDGETSGDGAGTVRPPRPRVTVRLQRTNGEERNYRDLVDLTHEHERKLDAPAGFRLPELGGSPLESRLFTSVYVDVPGGSLADAGITLRRRTERRKSVWQLKLPAGDARLEIEAPGTAAGPPEELRRLLAAHLRRGPLGTVATLRTRRSGELVSRNGTTAEVTVDEVAVLQGRRVTGEFVEVEIELRDGDPSDLDGIAGKIVRSGAELGDGSPKLFRVLGLSSRREARPRAPFEALRVLLHRQLREIHAHDPGTRLGADPESLHDMRVAVRRARALLRAGRGLVRGDTSALRADLKELGSVLGAVRDLDVLLERLRHESSELGAPDDAAAEGLLQRLELERSEARAALLTVLDGAAYLSLLDRFERAVEELEPSGRGASLDALARKQLRRLRTTVRALPPEPSDPGLHDVRKLGKRARYAAELAGNDKVVKRAKELQDVLGAHQDAVVAEERLRALAVDAPPAEALAAGRLIDRERALRTDARSDWRPAWKRLDRAGLR
jgi:CHAD domain-containing protein